RKTSLTTGFSASGRLLTLSKNWNLFLLPVALIISVPPWNAFAHGTHVIMAHAMGSELAIDSYILLGVFAWLFSQMFPKREVLASVVDSSAVRGAIKTLNNGLMLIVAVLLLRGLAEGYTRWTGEPRPEWTSAFPPVFAVSGLIVGYSLLRLVYCWLPLLRRPAPHKLFQHDPRWAEIAPGRDD
ncbi:MAG: hypothetical protein OER88_10815, partial [Planctomycetota bacterium]|nr:hypothetical protein [Planctomycetota bacterium]